MNKNLNYLSTREVAEILKIDPYTVRKYIKNYIDKKEGSLQLKGHKIGKAYIVHEDDLKKFIESQ